MNGLKICLLNLMPMKEVTERQFKSLFDEAGAPADWTFLTTATYKSAHTDAVYLAAKYKTLSVIKDERFDIFIITGAPVEQMAFEDVAYWDELKEILEYCKQKSLLNIFVCWAAQAALYYFYAINKTSLPQKYFGIFEQDFVSEGSPFCAGLKPGFLVPHSRHTSVRRGDIEADKNLVLLAAAGAEVTAVSSKDNKNLFITGHPEYFAQTLHLEYLRDLGKGVPTNKPANYYPGDDETRMPLQTWRAAALKLYTNIINHVNNLKRIREKQKYESI